jgi:hypothetical protein
MRQVPLIKPSTRSFPFFTISPLQARRSMHFAEEHAKDAIDGNGERLRRKAWQSASIATRQVFDVVFRSRSNRRTRANVSPTASLTLKATRKRSIRRDAFATCCIYRLKTSSSGPRRLCCLAPFSTA